MSGHSDFTDTTSGGCLGCASSNGVVVDFCGCRQLGRLLAVGLTWRAVEAEGSSCSICQEDVEFGIDVIALECKCEFHVECLQPSLDFVCLVDLIPRQRLVFPFLFGGLVPSV